MKKILTLLIAVIYFNVPAQEYRNDILLAKLKYSDSFSFSVTTDKSGKPDIKTNVNKIDLLNSEFKCKNLKHLFTSTPNEGMEKWLMFEFEATNDFNKLFESYSQLSDYLEVVEKYPIPVIGSLPNDPLINPTSCKALFDSKFPDAWDIQTGSPNVAIGVIDLGLDWSHPDISINNLYQNLGEDADGDGHTLEIINGVLQFDPGDLDGIDNDGNGKIDDLAGWDFKSNDNNIFPYQPTDDHGLNMSGIIAAAGNNNEGAAGVAYTSKVLNCRAGQQNSMDGDWIGAIYYLADIGVNIINMSFFGSGYSQAAQNAINYAYNTKGCVVVACGGYTTTGCPSSTFYQYPAAYDNVLGVSVLDHDGEHMRLSTYVNDKLDALASTTFRWPWYNPGTGQFDYGYSMHTSGTTAMVSGLAALLISQYPSWTNDSVVNQIRMTCTNVEDANRTNSCSFDFYDKIGHGLMNAHKALTFTGTIDENTIWNKSIKVFHNIKVNTGKTLTLRPNTNLEFQSSKTFEVFGNLVVEGNLTVNQDIEIKSGGNVTFASGAMVNFTSGKSLIVNGTLNAYSTTFTSSSNWGGIRFNSGSSGNLDGCTITNVQTYGGAAIAINNTSVTVQNCTIQNNSGATYGISVIGNGSSYLYNNDILNNSNHGIFIYNHGNAYLRHNTITASNTTGRAAVSCDYYSTPLFGAISSPTDGQNTLQNGYYGLYVNYYSNINAGGSGVAYNNRLLNNSFASLYASNSTVTIQNAWWGTYRLDLIEDMIINNNSTVTFQPFLTSDPGQANRLVSNEPGNEVNLSSSKINSPSDKKKEIASLWKNYKDSKDNSIINYLENIIAGSSDPDGIRPIALEVLAGIYIYEKNNGEAEKLNKILIKDYKQTVHEKNGLMNLFFIYYNAADYNQAEKTIESVPDEFKSNAEVYLAYWLLGKEQQGTIGSELSQQIGDGLPNSFTLNGNFPNPFNPSTTVTYTLPYQSAVELMIYDIMGREIRSFNTVQSAGTQNIYWNGLNSNGESISSGIYFYKLKLKSLETNDVFERTAKLLMLK